MKEEKNSEKSEKEVCAWGAWDSREALSAARDSSHEVELEQGHSSRVSPRPKTTDTTSSENFSDRIKKMTDEERAYLCFALAEGKPIKLPNRYINYLLSLIHCE
jgi:hypothetical protein